MLLLNDFFLILPAFFCFFFFVFFFSPEFSYRPGLGIVAESSSNVSSPGATGSGGAPNRPLPPTPDDDDSQGDKTLVLRRVSFFSLRLFLFEFDQKKFDV